MTKKPKASASDFDDLLGGADESFPVAVEKASARASRKPEPSLQPAADPPKAKRSRGRPAIKGNDTQTTFYYPLHWKKRLKEQALHEDQSVNDLILEGVRLMFAKRGIDPDAPK